MPSAAGPIIAICDGLYNFELNFLQISRLQATPISLPSVMAPFCAICAICVTYIPAICDGPKISAISAISAGPIYQPSVMAPFCAFRDFCVTKFIFPAKFNQLSQTFRIFAPTNVPRLWRTIRQQWHPSLQQHIPRHPTTM